MTTPTTTPPSPVPRPTSYYCSNTLCSHVSRHLATTPIWPHPRDHTHTHNLTLASKSPCNQAPHDHTHVATPTSSPQPVADLNRHHMTTHPPDTVSRCGQLLSSCCRPRQRPACCTPSSSPPYPAASASTRHCIAPLPSSAANTASQVTMDTVTMETVTMREGLSHPHGDSNHHHG